MDALKNKNVGYAVAAVGVLLALIGAFADTLGIGAEDAEGMGGKQLALLLAGVVVLGAGLAVVFLSGPSDDSSPTAEADTEADTEPDTVVDVTTEPDEDEDEPAETESESSTEADTAEATDTATD